jgi:hypothetical protein
VKLDDNTRVFGAFERDRAHAATKGFDLPSMPAWYEDALCAQVDQDMFFPEKGGPTNDARAVCAMCPVASKCLDYALANHERFGIWGGLVPEERRKLEQEAS